MSRISRVFLLGSTVAALGYGQARADQALPNILWITSEDNGPHLGCYGDSYAVTPNLDRLAKRSLRYTRASSTAPVCAPARTTIISGIYPPATGAEHMRSMTRLPAGFKMYPVYLRQLGYYCTNNSKEDYNLEKVGQVWDESGRKAHWKNRPDGKPFFAIFNHTISHESQIRNKINPADRIHDPAKVRIPTYHPDTPEVRKDWAQYHDRITMMDKLVGKNLRELEEAGLADDTIVFYYGDHGSGMPRSKRWPYFSGLNVPLIIHVPEKFKHLAPPEYKTGGSSDRLVGFIDLAPTLLELLGIRTDNSFQGVSLLAPVPNERRFALTNIGHVWNMRVGNHYCYSVGYSCFEGVFPRCPKGVEPTFAGHTCFESQGDVMHLADESRIRRLDAAEREQILGRARRILEVNRAMVVEGLFR
ncbi:MAG: hypothetical protein COC21_06705 [Verrucomicrobiales bacterium]|nr:MAG: hypothetical protein COC21_06705 [Verrucomicrobiales bacterium]